MVSGLDYGPRQYLFLFQILADLVVQLSENALRTDFIQQFCDLKDLRFRQDFVAGTALPSRTF